MKKLAGFVYVAASNIIRNENISYLSIKFRRVIARSKLEQKTPTALPGKEIVQFLTHDRITRATSWWPQTCIKLSARA